jgi:putative flavoprotein involved in K+ transport
MTGHGRATNGRPAGAESLDVIVIGGSQAGLAMAWDLAQHKLRFVVLEAADEVGR